MKMKTTDAVRNQASRLARCGLGLWHAAIAQWRERQAGAFRLRISLNALTIVVPAATNPSDSDAGAAKDVAGGIYRVPRTRRFAVVQRGHTLQFAVNGGTPVDVPFGSASDATAALDQIGGRLLSRRPLVWTVRLVVLGVVWLLVSSYLQVRAHQAAIVSANSGTAAAASAPAGDGSALANLPDVDSPFQALPAATAADATAPATPGEPATPAATPTTPLGGFGLDLGGSGPAPAPAATTAAALPASAASSGPGCDPALAFKAPAR